MTTPTDQHGCRVRTSSISSNHLHSTEVHNCLTFKTLQYLMIFCFFIVGFLTHQSKASEPLLSTLLMSSWQICFKVTLVLGMFTSSILCVQFQDQNLHDTCILKYNVMMNIQSKIGILFETLLQNWHTVYIYCPENQFPMSHTNLNLVQRTIMVHVEISDTWTFKI